MLSKTIKNVKAVKEPSIDYILDKLNHFCAKRHFSFDAKEQLYKTTKNLTLADKVFMLKTVARGTNSDATYVVHQIASCDPSILFNKSTVKQLSPEEQRKLIQQYPEYNKLLNEVMKNIQKEGGEVPPKRKVPVV
jgi:hypothetical protein